MARAKKPNKTRKTALKRLKKTNPKGNRKAKLRYNQTKQHHLRTKLSSRAKRRRRGNKVVNSSVEKKYNKIVNV
jgi:ribosomal protein L35